MTSKLQASNAMPAWARGTFHFIFIFYSLICILPVVLILSVSLTNEHSLLANGYRFIPESISTLAYTYLWKDISVMARAYGVTTFVTVVGAGLHVLLTAMYAYPLSRKDFPFKSFFSVIVLITMLFSGGLVPSYIVMVNVLHLKNTIWALILPNLMSGFNIFMVRTFFKQSIPDELIESAKIDGASEWRILFQIVLPLALPVLATIGLFSTIGYWNNWFNALLYISDKNLYTLQFIMQQALLRLEFIRNTLALGGQHLDLARTLEAQVPTDSVRMALVISATGPIILAYPFFQKYFIKGLTIGSVKG